MAPIHHWYNRGRKQLTYIHEQGQHAALNRLPSSLLSGNRSFKLCQTCRWQYRYLRSLWTILQQYMHNINMTHIKRQCSVLLGKYKASNSIQFNTRRFFKIPIFGTCVGFGDSLTYSGKPDHWNNKVVFETVDTNFRQPKKNRQDPDSRKFLKNFSDPPLENIAQYWGWLSWCWCHSFILWGGQLGSDCDFSIKGVALVWLAENIFAASDYETWYYETNIKEGKQSSANTFNRNYFVVSTYSFDSCTVPSMCFFKKF